ncbi:MAG: hypothetical protein V1777_00470 [Candidatus Micrarchaeota archaeon]
MARKKPFFPKPVPKDIPKAILAAKTVDELYELSRSLLNLQTLAEMKLQDLAGVEYNSREKDIHLVATERRKAVIGQRIIAARLQRIKAGRLPLRKEPNKSLRKIRKGK